MANETKTTDRNGSERIIKRNKTKISIIVIGVLVLLTLIGVGIYLIVKATKKYDYSIDNIEMNAKVEDVSKDIRSHKPADGNYTGIFFYTDDSDSANYLMRGDQLYKEGTDGDGPLAEAITSETDSHFNDYTWYGVNLDKADYIIEKLFLQEVDSSEGTHIFYDEFEYLTNPSSGVETWYFDNIDYSSYEGIYSLEDDAKSIFFDAVETPDNEDYTTDIQTRVDGASTASTWDPQAGTTMLFNGTTLTSVVNGWTIPPSRTSTDTPDSENETTIKGFFGNAFEELDGHNQDI